MSLSERGGNLGKGRYSQPGARNVTVKTTVGGVRSADVSSSKQNACAAKKRSVAGTKRRKSKASTTFFFVALLPLVRRSSLRAPNHDGTVVESAAHCCSQRDGERAHERRQREQHQGAARRTSRGESAELQVSREGGGAAEFCVLRAPALLHVRALRSRYPRAPLLCIPCLVRRHHGSLRLMPHADHSPCGSCTSGSPSCASPTRDTALSTSSLVAARRLAAQRPCARKVACTRGLPRSPHASGQQDSMYACVSLCLCARRLSTTVRTSKRHSVTFCGTQQHKRQPLRQIPYSSACTCR